MWPYIYIPKQDYFKSFSLNVLFCLNFKTLFLFKPIKPVLNKTKSSQAGLILTTLKVLLAKVKDWEL